MGRWFGFERIGVLLGFIGDLLEDWEWLLDFCVGIWLEKCMWCWECVDEDVWVMFLGFEDFMGDIFDFLFFNKGKILIFYYKRVDIVFINYFYSL